LLINEIHAGAVQPEEGIALVMASMAEQALIVALFQPLWPLPAVAIQIFRQGILDRFHKSSSRL